MKNQVAPPDPLELALRRSGLTEAGLDLVREVRRRNAPVSDPGLGAVTGHFQSRKMSRNVLSGSRTVERVMFCQLDQPVHPAIEFHEQPFWVEKVVYRKLNALRTTHISRERVDVLVIERHPEDVERVRVVAREAKTWEEIEELVRTDPARYEFDAQGRPHDRVLESLFMERWGIEHEMWTNRDVPIVLYENWVHVADYVDRPIDVDAQIAARALRKAREFPGDSLEQLHERVPELTVDVRNQLFANQLRNRGDDTPALFGNLHVAHLTQPKLVRVFASRLAADAILYEPARRPAPARRFSLVDGARLRFGDKEFQIVAINNEKAKVLLQVSGAGAASLMDRSVLEQLVEQGEVTGALQAPPSIASLMKDLSPKAEIRMGHRLDRLRKMRAGDRARNSSERRLLADSKAREQSGVPWEGAACPNFVRIGRRGERRVPSNSIDFAKEILETYYLIPIVDGALKSVRMAYDTYTLEARKSSLPAISRGTFISILEEHWSKADIAGLRRGRKAAAQVELAAPLRSGSARHGLGVWERAHIDHTRVDMVLIDLATGEVVSMHAWLSLARDAYSGRMLAYVLAWHSPSVLTLQLLLRDLVARWHRLPQFFVVDNGREFKSVFFVNFCKRYEIHIDDRPSKKAKYGGPIEEGLQRINEFLQQLSGSTVTLQKVREQDSRLDPQHHAKWSLPQLELEVVQPFLFEVFDVAALPVSGRSPRDIYAESVATSGERPNDYVAYDEDFLVYSAPYTQKKDHKVYPDGTIRIGPISYSCTALRQKGLPHKVPTRFEPSNIALAWVFIDEKWHKCESERFRHLDGHSSAELELATKEYRTRFRRDAKNPAEIVQFLLDSKTVEMQLLRQRQSEQRQPVRLVSPADRPPTDGPLEASEIVHRDAVRTLSDE